MTPSATAVADPEREPVPLAHHFDDPEQQHESATLGMWAFLATEVMFFGGVLTAYTVFRVIYPKEFAAASHYGLNLWIGGFNTLVLLGSSLAVALAVHASQIAQQAGHGGLPAADDRPGTSFLGIKAYEYSLEFRENLFPGPGFSFEHHAAGLDVRKVELFFVLYFFMTVAACVPHDHRAGHHRDHRRRDLAPAAAGRRREAGRDHGPLLALRRHRLGLPLSLALPDPLTRMSHEHITPVRTYLVVFAILVVLLVATIGASFLPLGRFTLVVALAIAFAKAVLIAIYFMHLRSSNRLTWVFSGAALLWFGILMTLTLNDYLTRAWLDIPAK